MILVDTSVWVEFFRNTGSAAHVYLRALIDLGETVGVTEPVIMEVTAGARSEADALEMREGLLAFRFLPIAGLGDFEGAASIYRTCRRGGETVRSHVDCLVAAVAIRTNSALLHADADFEVIARHTSLRIEPVP